MTFRFPIFSFKTKLCLLLGLVSLLVYANTLRNGYAIDDFILIKNNTIVTKGVAAIPEIFSTPYFKGNLVTSFDYYRPLSLAMFAIEHDLFGDSPFAGHLVNILLFAGCIVLLFLFLDELFGRQKTGVALITCLLFALHPVNTEVVANIKSRDQLLCFFFSFFAMNLFIKFVRDGKTTQLLTGFFLFFLSLLSKETSITFLAVIPLVFFFYRNENKRRSLYITVSAFIATFIYLAIRFSILGSAKGGINPGFTFLDNILAYAPGIGSRLATEILVLGRYLKLLLIPYPLISDYAYNTISFTGFSDFRVLLSLIIYIAMMVIAVYRLIKKNKDSFAFAILFYLISISIFSNIFFLIAGIMAERFLFFAAIGFCMVPALLIDKYLLPETGNGLLKNKKALLIIIPVAIIYSLLTVTRNTQWYDNHTLFKADLKNAPSNCHLLYNLGTNLIITADDMQQNDPARLKLETEGINYLKKAITIYPAFGLAYSEIANTYFHEVNYDSSEAYCKKALDLNAHDVVAMENLAAIYFKTGKYAQSLEVCKKSVKLDSNYARGYRNIGNCYLRMNEYDSAVIAYKKAIIIEPSVNVSYERIAIAYKLAGNMDSAKKYLETAQLNNPEFNY